ncbi:hypothetical protein [Synechocystis sp. FACHB-383]|uniref:hypothetical protein n=1 Tax=Synechocystis sp. FACHB-383 TaxID=2692864 RepID=UPI001F54C18B|nr:hypothetical protein [Synechocystis sp. FACHB-383]
MVNNSPTLRRRSPIVLLAALLSFGAGALVFVPVHAGEVENPHNPFGYEDADQVDYKDMDQENYQDLTEEKSVNDNSLDYEQDNEYENDNQYEYKDQDDFNYRDMN